MRSLLVAIALLTLPTSAALAQAVVLEAPVPVISDQDARMTLAERYLALTVDLDVDKMMREQMDQGFAGSPATEEQREWITEQMSGLYEEVIDNTLREMRGGVAELYTLAELQALVAFYEGPLGPSLARKNMEAGLLMQEAMMPHLVTGLTDVFQKYCLRFDCEAMGAAAAKQNGLGR